MSETVEQDKPGPRPVLFALLMPWGRVGSHLVTMALNDTPGISVENEPTTAIRTRGHAEGLDPAEIGARQMRHLHDFTVTHPPGRIGAGLKLSHRSLVDQTGYLQKLSDLEFRLVLLLRRNFLKCAVSQMRALSRAQEARHAGKWASPWAVRTEEPKPGPEPLDAAEAIRLTQLFEKLHHRMMRNVKAVFGQDCKCVEYEDLAAEPDRVIREVFGYLDLPAPEVIRIHHRKATSDCLKDDILNYDAFAEAVRDAGLEAFL